MKFYVAIEWEGRLVYLLAYKSQADAEWGIAQWRKDHGSNGKDTGFRVIFVEDMK